MGDNVVKASMVYKSQFDKNKSEYTSVKLGYDAKSLKRLEAMLEGIEGQEYACQCVKEYFFGIRHRAHEKGLGGSLTFAGAPAVGKTILAERIAKCLDVPFLRIDMSTKNDKESSVFELFGIHPSYKAACEGVLTGFVRNNPNCVILLDECEKAHINVLNSILQVYERGEIEDKFTGKPINLRDVIIIVTTNVGKDIYDGSVGKYIFSNVSRSVITKALKTEINPLTKAPFFTDALVSRFNSGKVIMFNKLRPEVIHKILSNDIQKQINHYKTLYGIDVKIDIDSLATLLILNQGESADIRTLLSAGGEIFHKSMSCGVETTMDTDESQMFTELCLDVSYDDAQAEVKSLLFNDNKSRILVYCDKNDEKYFTAYASDKLEFVFAREGLEVNEIGKMDITAVFLDVSKRGSGLSRDIFDYCTGNESIPTYVYNTRSVGRSFFYYYVEHGASECYSPKISSLDLMGFIGKITAGLDLNYMTKELFRVNKIINYDIDYSYDAQEKRTQVSIHNLRIETAISASEMTEFVSSRDIPNVKYDDIIGADSAKAELKRASRFVTNYKRYIKDGIRIPRGILLEGEPGCGKTTLAKAFANETKLPFIQKNATEFLIKWIGDGAKAIRDLFALARKYAPCVLFIDEVDTIAMSRQGEGSERNHTKELTNAFLSEMDGFCDNSSAPVFVICATNFKTRKNETRLDEAFLRRFDKRIYVELPKKEQREMFLEKALGKIKGSEVTKEVITQIARRTIGWSLADLSLVVQNALRKYEDETGNVGVDDKHLIEELESFNDGDKKARSEESIRKTAIHEAGHALVGKALDIPVVHATIVGRGDYGGYVYHGDEEKDTYTKGELLDKICMSLGGRCAEILEYGEDGINTSASSDLKNATRLAKAIVCDYGMTDDFLMVLDNRESDLVIGKVRAILKEQYQRTMEIIKTRLDKLHSLASELASRNSLCKEEIEAILANN